MHTANACWKITLCRHKVLRTCMPVHNTPVACSWCCLAYLHCVHYSPPHSCNLHCLQTWTGSLKSQCTVAHVYLQQRAICFVSIFVFRLAVHFMLSICSCHMTVHNWRRIPEEFFWYVYLPYTGCRTRCWFCRSNKHLFQYDHHSIHTVSTVNIQCNTRYQPYLQIVVTIRQCWKILKLN